jgi:histidine ammonia-lyase
VTVVVDSRRDLSLDNFRRVAVGEENVRLGDRARRAMAAARSSFVQLLEQDRTAFIYGVTSGHGHQARFRVPPDEQASRAQALFEGRSRGAGFGERLDDRVVRGIVFARLANFVEGHAKVRPVVADRVAAVLEGPLPPVPAYGQVGAGEILPLYHLWSSLPPADYEEGEALALINGSPCAAALAADAALAGAARLELAGQVFALSVEAYRAPLDAYDPDLAALWPDPFEAAALQDLRRHLEGVGADGRRPFQAPVSYRVLPRVLAGAHRAQAALREAAETSLRAVTDNPVYILPTPAQPLGRVLSTGGYHNGMAYPALDGLSAAWADLCTLADRHTTKLHDGEDSGLPHLLRKAGSPGHGPSTFGLAMVQVGLGEDARHAAARTFIPGSEGGGLAQNDVACPTFLAYAKHQRASRALEGALAILAVTASQALWVTGRRGPPALGWLLSLVRSYVPPLEGPGRPLGIEVGALAQALGDSCLGERTLAPARQASFPPGPVTTR